MLIIPPAGDLTLPEVLFSSPRNTFDFKSGDTRAKRVTCFIGGTVS